MKQQDQEKLNQDELVDQESETMYPSDVRQDSYEDEEEFSSDLDDE